MRGFVLCNYLIIKSFNISLKELTHLKINDTSDVLQFDNIWYIVDSSEDVLTYSKLSASKASEVVSSALGVDIIFFSKSNYLFTNVIITYILCFFNHSKTK